MTASNSMQSMNNPNASPLSMDSMVKSLNDIQLQQQSTLNNQEDETFYTRELIHIYGQPIVPSFHKYFNYQLSNTHYGYRTLRRLLNCDILKKYVKVIFLFFSKLMNNSLISSIKRTTLQSI